jgi:hypothetical protein
LVIRVAAYVLKSAIEIATTRKVSQTNDMANSQSLAFIKQACFSISLASVTKDTLKGRPTPRSTLDLDQATDSDTA